MSSSARNRSVKTLLLIMCGTFIIFSSKSHQFRDSDYVLSRGPIVPAVALTFDDGPGESTDTILRILKSRNVKATFFLIGKNAQRHPELTRRVAHEGHEIGNHTYSHPMHASMNTPRMVRLQMDSTDRILHEICGITTEYFRPPHGWHSPWMIAECKKNGKTLTCWTIDSQDWRKISATHMVRSVLRRVKHGSIILFHDRLNTGKEKSRSATVEALPLIIDSLMDRGYSFLTVGQLHRSGIAVDSVACDTTALEIPTEGL